MMRLLHFLPITFRPFKFVLARTTEGWPIPPFYFSYRRGIMKAVSEKWAAQRKYKATPKGKIAHQKSIQNLLLKDPQYWKWRHIIIKYNINKDDVLKRLEHQNYTCPICKGLLSLSDSGGQSVSIDHDHQCCPGAKSCGKCIRGILHQECNGAIGRLKDRHDFCMNAANYLKNWKDGYLYGS